MANTGYIINPKVIQVFTTGPDSGSIVSSSFTIEFSGSFTSSLLCNQTYQNKIFDPINCVVSNFCISPKIAIIQPFSSCDDDPFNYTYVITYNTNSPSASQSIIEYSLQPDFSGETGSSGIINNYSQSMEHDLFLDLQSYPLYQYDPIYFRIKNICSGSSSTSSYSVIEQFNCEPPPQPTLYPIFLRRGCFLHGPSVLYYVDGTDFPDAPNPQGSLYSSTFICNTNNPFNYAPTGIYSNGYIFRNFDGNIFNDFEYCFS